MAKNETSHKGKKTLYKRFIAVLGIVTILVGLFAVTASASEGSTQDNARYYLNNLAPSQMYSNDGSPIKTIIDVPETYSGEQGVTNASVYYGTKYTVNGANNSVTDVELKATSYRYETGISEVYYNSTDLATAFGENVALMTYYKGHTLEWRNFMLNEYATDSFSIMFRSNTSGRIQFKVTVDAIGFDDENRAHRYSDTSTYSLPLTDSFTAYRVMELIHEVAYNATGESFTFIERAIVEISFSDDMVLHPTNFSYCHKHTWAPYDMESAVFVDWLNEHRYQDSDVITGVVDLIGTAFQALDVTLLKIDQFELTIGGILTILTAVALFTWFIKQFAGG